ncbi:MAG: hypothetical protein H7Y42_02160 [Chitinophagaceae bacterium]|nr:hypothetical protein [Chitinophagaceae bacterium]
MYRELYDYLILHKQLNIPGVGLFAIERKPSQTDITQRIISSPAYTITMQATSAPPAKRFFNWLSERLELSYPDTIVQYNGFAIELRNRILSGTKVNWKEVGVLSRGMGGEIKFDSQFKERSIDQPITAVRVIRDKAVHSVRVGEQHKTSREMTEWLQPVVRSTSRWWVPATIVGALLFIIIVFYFIQNGFHLSSTANQGNLTPSQENATHRIINSE